VLATPMRVLIEKKLLDYTRYDRIQRKLRSQRRELLLFCEHASVVTGGVQSKSENLISDEGALAARGIQIFRVGRGGDFTAHEPGQIVIYPHLDMAVRKIGLANYFNGLLRISKNTLEQVWKIETEIQKESPGLYTRHGKIASIGIMFKSFFTSSGMAINVKNSLRTFEFIHPCGRPGQPLTTVEREGGDPGKMDEFRAVWASEFARQLERAFTS